MAKHIVSSDGEVVVYPFNEEDLKIVKQYESESVHIKNIFTEQQVLEIESYIDKVKVGLNKKKQDKQFAKRGENSAGKLHRAQKFTRNGIHGTDVEVYDIPDAHDIPHVGEWITNYVGGEWIDRTTRFHTQHTPDWCAIHTDSWGGGRPSKSIGNQVDGYPATWLTFLFNMDNDGTTVVFNQKSYTNGGFIWGATFNDALVEVGAVDGLDFDNPIPHDVVMKHLYNHRDEEDKLRGLTIDQVMVSERGSCMVFDGIRLHAPGTLIGPFKSNLAIKIAHIKEK